jgi:hypothetical protein
MEVPTISAKKLWHWGALDIQDRYKNGVSLEGHLFSMSACPLAWQQIARLGGSPLHIRNQSSVLLDMHAALYDKRKKAVQFRQHVEQWALNAGLVEYRDVYQTKVYDDELDDFRVHEFATLAEAEEEIDGLDEEVQTLNKLIGTPALNQSHNFPASYMLGFEYALIDWAKSNLSSAIQGVYWDETLDPLGFSAPRAGMFDATALGLAPAPYVPDDNDGLKGISPVKWLAMDDLVNQHSAPQP